MATHSVEDLGTMLTSRLIQADRAHRDRKKPAEVARTTRYIDWVVAGNFSTDRGKIDFSRWRALRQVYDAVPLDPNGWDETIMKPTQGGASIKALTFSLFLALRKKCRGAYFLPVAKLATTFSQDRFIHLIRDNPTIHRLMGDPGTPHRHQIVDEGSATTRRILESIIYFTYVGGTISTEALALDFLIFDEVQEMLLADMEKAQHRLDSATLAPNGMRGTILRVSTANFAGADIHYHFERSDGREFLSRCGCADWVNLSEQWDPQLGPLCIDKGNGSTPGVPTSRFFVCPKCKTILDDVQDGLFVARRPTEKRVGFHWAQMLSPEHNAESMYDSWINRIDTKNFYNRVLGLPYADPNTLPVQQSHLEEAQNRDLTWGMVHDDIEATFLGIDQMGALNVAVVKARVRGSDKQRVIWLEMIQAEDPWHRCAELMRRFKIKVCGVEALPNFNEAHRFAKEFAGKVFLVNYQDLAEELVVWGDRPREKVTVRRTDEMARTKYTAAVDQFRMMSFSLGKWVAGEIETPDARALVQEVRTDRGVHPTMICRDVLWLHLQRVALVTEYRQGKEDERRLRRAVKKVGIDPHFAFANMLCDVAWVRVFGTARLLYDETDLERGTTMTQGAPRPSGEMEQLKRGLGDRLARASLETCGTCVNFDASAGRGRCSFLNVFVTAETYKCGMYSPIPEEETYP